MDARVKIVLDLIGASGLVDDVVLAESIVAALDRYETVTNQS